jgi:hypothetical protein
MSKTLAIVGAIVGGIVVVGTGAAAVVGIRAKINKRPILKQAALDGRAVKNGAQRGIEAVQKTAQNLKGLVNRFGKKTEVVATVPVE